MSVAHLELLPEDMRLVVLDLIQRSTIFDNSPPIAEHILLHLRHGGDKSDSHLVIKEQSKVIGYAHLDQTDLVAGPSVALVVDPDHRSFGIGKQLLSKAIEICGPKLRLWVHNENLAANNLATSFNFEKIRTVLQMQKILKGFFIATIDDQLIGSTWTKIHGALTHDHGGSHDHPAMGEIYITAVDPDHSGIGLGRALTITALNYLKYQGLTEAMLYVDFDNAKALKLYNSLGFTESGKDILYRLKA